MSQRKILKFLRNNPKDWYFATDISQATDVNVVSTYDKLKKLRAWGMVDFRLNEHKLSNLHGKRDIYEYKNKEKPS